MEWLNTGQHIELYAIEILKGGKWTEITRGRAIGHKRIDHFPAVTASRIRLNILSSVGDIHIREFQLFNVNDTHP